MSPKNKDKIIAFAIDFISYLKENHIEIKKAILFGSIVTGEFDKESDVDIFIETKENEEKIQDILTEFEKTLGENWRLKGIDNTISLKIGNLEKWPELRRSIQSNGLMLYGPYIDTPKKIKNYILFILDFKDLPRSKKVSVWRRLYGYKQTINNKKYSSYGFIIELDGKKLERGIISIPSENSIKFKDFLKKHKIKYKLYEIWSDSL